jgi:hypothetical protein
LQEAPVLLYQNKAMQIRIKEMRMEIQSHEETINLFKERQLLHDETLSCTHRVLDQVFITNQGSIIINFYIVTR